MKALIVDDDRVLADVVAFTLRREGFEIVMAYDGDTALEMVARAEQSGHPYDLLLIDWVMPRLDGAGLLKALQDRSSDPMPLPVIVSAYDSDVVHGAAKALGAHHFLPKPVLPESLRDLVRWLAGTETNMHSQDATVQVAPDLGAIC